MREPGEKVPRKRTPQQWPPAKVLMSVWRHSTFNSGAEEKGAELTASHHVIHFLLFAVSSVILPQGSHQNHGDQSDQKNDHHERVEDGEPVNLGDKNCSQ